MSGSRSEVNVDVCATAECCGRRLVVVDRCRMLLPDHVRRAAWQLLWDVAHDDWQWAWLDYSACGRANAVGMPSILH